MKDSSLSNSESPIPDNPPTYFFWKLLFALVEYHTALPIQEYRRYRDNSIYYICPRCDSTLDREYQVCCDRCGQRLEWKGYRKAKQRE